MSARIPTAALAALTTGVGLLLAGCTTAPAADAPLAHETQVGFGHVHAVVDLGDGTVLLGTHTGLYTLTETGALTGPADGADFDAMGLTGAGGILYASGHPGPDTPAELGAPNLGIIRSTDAGLSWEPVAFTGQEDFHVLTATADGILHGVGSSSITVRTSTDRGVTWSAGAELAPTDLAGAADGSLYATTQDGLQCSEDGGVTFTPVAGAPLLYLVETDPGGGLVGVDTDGTLWAFDGTTWERVGTAAGTVQALGVSSDGAVVLVDDRGVVWVRGAEATVVLPTEATS